MGTRGSFSYYLIIHKHDESELKDVLSTYHVRDRSIFAWPPVCEMGRQKRQNKKEDKCIADDHGQVAGKELSRGCEYIEILPSSAWPPPEPGSLETKVRTSCTTLLRTACQILVFPLAITSVPRSLRPSADTSKIRMSILNPCGVRRDKNQFYALLYLVSL